jgi:hypothetical protein
MLPLISFETGRRTLTQSSGQLQKLHQQMEVWFSIERNPGREANTHALSSRKNLHKGSSAARQETFCLLTKTYHGRRKTGPVPTWTIRRFWTVATRLTSV